MYQLETRNQSINGALPKSQKSRKINFTNNMKVNIFLITVITLMITGCKSNSSPSMPNIVSISGLSFSPKTFNVSTGATVTWKDNEAITHTVTSDTGLFDSGDLTQGKTFTYTFSVAGTYPYHCTHHASMTGTIVVTTPTNTGGY